MSDTYRLSDTVRRILRRAEVEAELAKRDAVEPAHLLIGILQEGKTSVSSLLVQKEITVEDLREIDFNR